MGSFDRRPNFLSGLDGGDASGLFERDFIFKVTCFSDCSLNHNSGKLKVLVLLFKDVGAVIGIGGGFGLLLGFVVFSSGDCDIFFLFFKKNSSLCLRFFKART